MNPDFPFEALIVIDRVMDTGQKQGHAPWGWDGIPKSVHISKAINHLYKHAEGSTEEPHLEHALCRLAMAVATTKEE